MCPVPIEEVRDAIEEASHGEIFAAFRSARLRQMKHGPADITLTRIHPISTGIVTAINSGAAVLNLPQVARFADVILEPIDIFNEVNHGNRNTR